MNESKYLDVLRQTGQKILARRDAEVSDFQVRLHRKNDPDFADREAEALELFRAEKIDDEIRRRGVEGVKRTIYYLGEPVGEEVNLSDRLLLAWAKRHDPAYRDHITVDQTVDHTSIDLDIAKLDPESQDLLRQLLERNRGGEEVSE